MTNLYFITLQHNSSANHPIQPVWIILDTCTSRSVSNNTDMLTDIIDGDNDNYLRLHTNGGPAILDQKAKLKIFSLRVHFKKESMATILSFSDVCDIDDIKVIFD